MAQAQQRILTATLLLIIITVLDTFFMPPPVSLGSAEADRYYHFAMAKRFASEWVPRSIPQVEDLGWKKYFPEKEFLFHELSGLAYRMDGETAVLALVPILGLLILLSLYFLGASIAPPWVAGIITIATVLLHPEFLNRLFLLRPHLLSITLFIWVLYGAIHRKQWISAIACGASALSYHAIYILIAVLILCSIPTPWQKRWEFRCLAAGVIGIIFGVLINPYFPSNLLMSWMHVKIALGLGYPSELKSMLGLEVLPPPSSSFIHSYGAGLVIAILGFFFLLQKRVQNELLWRSLLLLIAFFMLTGLSPRAGEYYVPILILYVAALYQASGKHYIYPVAALSLLAVVNSHGTYAFFDEIENHPYRGITQSAFRALDEIPVEAAGKKVYNCNWSLGSFILYRRPDLRFVDLLDPTFLYSHSPELSHVSVLLHENRVPDPHDAIRNVFHSDYVLCNNPWLNPTLEHDPRFHRLYPKGENVDFNDVLLFSVDP